MEVAIIMGSKSDFPIVLNALEILAEFNISAEIRVLSAHRTPIDLNQFLGEIQKKGVKLFIAAAGGAAHLAGVVAAHTVKPVIGIPIKSEFNSGLDSLLSTCQMPSGVPVATVAVNGAKNAALLAVEILAINNQSLTDRLKTYRLKLRENVLKSDMEISEKLNEISQH